MHKHANGLLTPIGVEGTNLLARPPAQKFVAQKSPRPTNVHTGSS